MLHQTLAKMHHVAQRCRREGLLRCYYRDVTFWDRDYVLRSRPTDTFVWIVKEAGTAIQALSRPRDRWSLGIQYWLTTWSSEQQRNVWCDDIRCFYVDALAETVEPITPHRAWCLAQYGDTNAGWLATDPTLTAVPSSAAGLAR